MTIVVYDLFLQHEFVNRSALCAALMLPLICVLEAPPPKSRTLADEETEEEMEEEGPPENRVGNVSISILVYISVY